MDCISQSAVIYQVIFHKPLTIGNANSRTFEGNASGPLSTFSVWSMFKN